MAVYLADARLALANLLGEDSISQPWPTVRDNCIQWGLERIARIYDFDFGQEVLTKTTDASGKYVFLSADGVRVDPKLDVRIVVAGSANDHVFEPVNREDFDSYTAGDYKYYLDTDASGNQTLVTTELSSSIQITATRKAPVISDTVSSNFPSALAIAKAALIYYREYEDKDADTSVEDAKFQQIIQEIAGVEQRENKPQRAMSKAEMMGHRMGEVPTDRYWTYYDR